MRYYYMKKIRQNLAVEPLSLSVLPSQITLGRPPQESLATFQVSLNRNPGSPVAVTVSSSDPSAAVSPASFVLGGVEPLSRVVSVSGASSGPDSVTIQVAAAGFQTQTVQVTRPPFLPNVLSGLALWLDAADASSITLDGSNNVQQWNDKSGNARHVSQATTTLRPSYVSAGQNGLNVVRLDGVNDYLRTTAGFTVNAPGTVYVVMKTDSGARGNALDGFDAGSNRWAVGSSADARAFAYQSAGPILDTSEASTMGSVGRLVTMQFVNGESKIRVDKIDKAFPGSIGTVVNFNGANIGRWQGGAGFYRGWIGEMLIYQGAHNATQTASVEGYLAAKWGVA